jgi:hypothetical protein
VVSDVVEEGKLTKKNNVYTACTPSPEGPAKTVFLFGKFAQYRVPEVEEADDKDAARRVGLVGKRDSTFCTVANPGTALSDIGRMQQCRVVRVQIQVHVDERLCRERQDASRSLPTSSPSHHTSCPASSSDSTA